MVTFEKLLRSNLRVGSKHDATLVAWLLLALACGFLAYVARVHEVTHDVFHEMALYREALVLGSFPTNDVFAFTPTVTPSVHHEWGTGAVLYLASVESGLGIHGIALLRLLLIAALWLLLYRVARMRGADPVVFAVVAAITFLFSGLVFQRFVHNCLRSSSSPLRCGCKSSMRAADELWVVAWWLMLVGWLNLHAGFIVGLAMFAAHCAERIALAWMRSHSVRQSWQSTWHLFAVAGCIPVALLINPYGWQYITYLMHALTMPRPLIVEWHALWNTYAPLLTMTAFTFSVLLFAYCQRYQRPSHMRGAAMLGLAAYEALSHIRHGSLYGAIWIAYVPAWLSHTPLGKAISQLAKQHRMNAIACSRLVVVGCVTFACVNTF